MRAVFAFVKNFFLTTRFFVLSGVIISMFLFSFFIAGLLALAKLAGVVMIFVFVADTVVLWLPKKPLQIRRYTPARLSNGDDNPVEIFIRSKFIFPVSAIVIDELPPLLQIRNLSFKKWIAPGNEIQIRYTLRPVVRGEYHFGKVHAIVSGLAGLTARRISEDIPVNLPCYPSFIHLRKYELMAVTDRYAETGHRRINSIGRSYEFDHIRNYSLGDDIRSINWKATARRDLLMINQFREEKSQQIYCVIDAGRTMKSPFDGMTLLDYAINASLVLSDVAVVKNDRPGLLVFSDHIHSMLLSNNRRSQISTVMEQLYNAETDFSESSFELMTINITRKVPRRSLVILFSNFEGRVSLKRQLPFLKQLAKRHLVLTVFFENTLLHEIVHQDTKRLSEVYIKTIAEKNLFERRFMAEDLARNGIIPLLTTPANLTVDTVNKYIEIKSRMII